MLKRLRRWLTRTTHEFEVEMEKRAGVTSDDKRQEFVDRHEMIERRLRERFSDPGTGKFKVQ